MQKKGVLTVGSVARGMHRSCMDQCQDEYSPLTEADPNRIGAVMPKGGLTDEHKKALARGRREAKAVRDYLEGLEASNRRSRASDPETIKRKLEQTQAKIAEEADPARRLELIQDRLDLEDRLADANQQPDMDDLEKRFKAFVKEYSERKGITYTAWREAGVPAAVLRDAGIPRTRRTV